MEKRFDILIPAASNMLRGNMGVKLGEKVLFLADVPKPEDWEKPFVDILEMADRALMVRRIAELLVTDFPENAIEFAAFPQTGQSGMEPDKETAHLILKYDVVIIMTTHSLSHTNARQNATDLGVRVASMPGIEPSMFEPEGPMNADTNEIDRDCRLWADRITTGNAVHVATPSGTDLKFSIAGRIGQIDNGIYREKHDWGNLPAGESYTAPVEGSAQGRLVVPKGWYPKLEEDMTLLFEKGFVTEVHGGGRVGEEFIRTFDFPNSNLLHRRNCAELGIGTNPLAKKMDNPLEAEKIKGTIHIAVGDSSHVGGVSESDLHVDFILCEPSLTIDGVKYL